MDSEGIRHFRSGFIRVYDAQQKVLPAGRLCLPRRKASIHSPVAVRNGNRAFSFLQALQNHHEKGGLIDGKRNDRN